MSSVSCLLSARESEEGSWSLRVGIYDQVGHRVSGTSLSTPGPKEHIQHSWGPYPTHLLFGPTPASKAEVILLVDKRRLRHSECRKQYMGGSASRAGG